MEIEYLSLVVRQGSIVMDLIKVAGVAEWIVPKMNSHSLDL